MGINAWDKEKFGTKAAEKGITFNNLGYDLIIFGRFVNSTEIGGEEVLASALPYYIEKETGQPILGLVNINKDVNYSLIHSQEYFQAIILHEFTHILGFGIEHFMFFNYILMKNDKNGIMKYYINSTRVVNTAKKYFNCPDLIGVELENFGGEGTAGSHWEARILLGDYMNGIIYTEEQVISEITLALLEDTGYYKANYYTGGLMRYGKNKGCEFINENCINEKFEINPNFENEFFDYFNQKFQIDPSCSSGRQSRTYNFLWAYKNEIPIEYQYYNNSFLGGYTPADYCPVASNYPDPNDNAYYIGHCSNKGSGNYGMLIPYYNEKTNQTFAIQSKYLQTINGEKYSENSFCYLSSLIKKTKTNETYLSETIRAVCYETFCSSKSWTIKIDNDYFVCPREGGKIKVINYDGYFLCPDYNLMCSGTVICNDMFDCVEKKSEIKEEGYNYDYVIKTNQNILKSENEDVDDMNNYELSEDGECPPNCKLCTSNKKCLECRNNYIFVHRINEEIIKCVDETKINIGYYINDSIYYECIDNCDICNNSFSCNICKENSLYIDNKCIVKIDGCEKYDENGRCQKCNENYMFINDKRNECIEIAQLDNYYSLDNGISYIKCDGEGINHIRNCKECHFNETLICDVCNENRFIRFNKCITIVENCEEYNENEECKKCIDGFSFIEDDKQKCVNNGTLEGYYTKDNGINYYKCDGEGPNHIKNCIKCHFNETLICDVCNNTYNFLNKCIEIIENCEEYNENEECNKCNDGFAIIEDDKNKCFNIEKLEKEYYTKDNGINYYKCDGEGANHIKNCKECHFNETLICDILK